MKLQTQLIAVFLALACVFAAELDADKTAQLRRRLEGDCAGDHDHDCDGVPDHDPDDHHDDDDGHDDHDHDDSPSGGAAQCFSKFDTVVVKDKGVIPMSSLAIGDHVRAGDEFSRVISMIHLAPEIEKDFLQIYSKAMHQEMPMEPLEVTPRHIVFVDGNKAVAASTLRVGDWLDESRVITDIQQVKRRGLYAPLTESGDITVNGVRASSYVALMDHVPGQHNLIHMFFAPRRAICRMNFAWCESETYTEEGYPTYVGWAIKAYAKCNALGAPAQYMLAAVVAPILSIWYTVEQFLVAPLLALATIGFLVYKSNSKKIKSV